MDPKHKYRKSKKKRWRERIGWGIIVMFAWLMGFMCGTIIGGGIK